MRGERYLRTSEVAHLLHVSPKTVSRWAKEGRLPHLSTLGGHRRFPASEIERMIEELGRMPPEGRSPRPGAEVGSG
jgi:excisionase family DNA binding protein